MPKHDRRLLRIRVTRPAMALPFIEGAAYVVEEGLPADSELVGWQYQAEEDVFQFVFETEAGEIIDECTEVPEQGVHVRDLEPEDVAELDYVNYEYDDQ